MLVILIGKTASGKDTIRERLCQIGLKKHVTYTTRPMRKGEVNHKSYHFISKSEFLQKINMGYFTEYKNYNSVDGTWYYGSSLHNLGDSDEVVILTPAGYKDIKSQVDNTLSVFISSDEETIKYRLKQRGDGEAESNRRLKHDNEDFIGIEEEVDLVVYNDLGANLDFIVNNIMSVLEDKCKKERS